MEIIKEIKQKVKKNHVNNFYNLWLNYHNYLLSLKDKKLKLDDYIKILRMFRSACSEVHENVCRVVNITKSGCIKCPLYNCCLKSEKSKTHKLYCEISYAAREKDEEKIKKLIDEIDDDSLKDLKLIEGSW